MIFIIKFFIAIIGATYPMLFLFLIILVVIATKYLKKYYQEKKYKNTTYYKITNLPFQNVLSNKGFLGEYDIYLSLSNFESDGARFLFNIYLPTKNNTTSEIDVLMIHKSGIFVFESKNYSGWIFGSENKKNWYQTLPAKHHGSVKEVFYNPIMQNLSHIRHLKEYIGNHVPMHSIVVFSDNCRFMDVDIRSKDIYVIHNRDIIELVQQICQKHCNNILTNDVIDEIYNKLYPFTQVSSEIKYRHIETIRLKHNYEQWFNSTNTDYVFTEKKDATFHKIDDISENECPPEANTNNELSDFADNTDAYTLYDTKELNAVAHNAFAHAKTESTQNNILELCNTSKNEVEQSEEPQNNVPEIELPHLDNPQSYHSNSIEEKPSLICPWCGGKLILRTARKGSNTGNTFYGCSNYPRCHYIKNKF